MHLPIAWGLVEDWWRRSVTLMHTALALCKTDIYDRTLASATPNLKHPDPVGNGVKTLG